jgi:glucose-6-phosphate isomerase
MSALGSQQYECLEFLLELKAPSRLGAQDASLFAAHPNGADRAQNLLGWATLCSKPPCPATELKRLADEIRAEGLEGVVLIGQGGSSQAAMTVTKLSEVNEKSDVAFKTMDSLSPVFVNHILGSLDPSRTLYVVCSKSGSTIEPLMLERVAWQYVSAHLGETAAARRFVAITDPNSGLEQLAHSKGYRLVLSTPVDVGGRFSALTAFALFPAALVGIDIVQAISEALSAECACRSDDPNNPALKLACFLYDSYLKGRDKFSLILPPNGQVFGLWVEQLVAESLGKEGKGILPNIEVDASVLTVPRADRSAITCFIGNCEGFRESIVNVDESIPAFSYTVNEPQDLFSHFVIWEYAIVLLSILLEVFPFDQPNVELPKRLVREMLSKKGSGLCDDCHSLTFDKGPIKSLQVSRALMEEAPVDIDQALRALFASLRKGDYFSLNAFLPFRGYGRREALERMRNRVASRLGVVSCLEIGPRYLHSTGQFHKGGPNTGVFLLLSADEDNDINVPNEDFTLGTLAEVQAQGDFAALASLNRRAVHVHLSGNESETLAQFADRICAAISATTRP